MTRLFLFATPALFVVCAGSAYLAEEHDKSEWCVALMVVALLMLLLWFAAVHVAEERAWKAGQRGQPL